MRTALSELESQMERDGYFKDRLDLFDLLLFADVTWHDYYSEKSILTMKLMSKFLMLSSDCTNPSVKNQPF